MKPKKDLTFGTAFSELEELVKKFESGKLDLEESLEHFERGLELAAFCKKYLGQIESKVVDIKKKFSKENLFVESDSA